MIPFVRLTAKKMIAARIANTVPANAKNTSGHAEQERRKMHHQNQRESMTGANRIFKSSRMGKPSFFFFSSVPENLTVCKDADGANAPLCDKCQSGKDRIRRLP